MRKTMIMTAALAGLVASSHAAIRPLNYDGTDEYDAGAYELLTGDSSNIAYSQSLNGYRGQTITVTNDFDLGAISIIYQNTVQDIIVSNLVVHVYEVADPLAASYVVPPVEETLFSGTFDAPASTGSDTLFLELGTNISLVAGSYYMIMFEDANASTNNVFRWRRSTSSSGADFYPGGLKVDEDGAVETARDFSLGLGLSPAPTANDDEYILPYAVSSLTVDAPGVLVNDVGFDSAVLVTNLSSGSLSFNADGSFSCSGLVNGSNTFSYAVVGGSVTSAPATVMVFTTLEAEVPIAVDDLYSLDLAFGAEITGNVLNNDTNLAAALELFALEVDSSSANGVVTLESNGSFTYVPSGAGTSTFTYRAYTVAATSEVATVTLIVEDSSALYMGIDNFESYDVGDVRDFPSALTNWNPNGSGAIEIRANSDGQYLKFGWDTRYRGAVSTANLFSGVPADATDYWLYSEIYLTNLEIDGSFGLTVNSDPSVASLERGDFTAGVRFAGDGTNITLYAFTGGGDASTDVLLGGDYAQDTWHGVWLNINKAANTYDVYIGDAGDASIRGTQVGTNIAFETGGAELVSLLVSSTRDAYIDNIIEIDPIAFINTSPAILSGISHASNGSMQLNISLHVNADAATYWPISTANLAADSWEHVAHSDAPDGTFAITSLAVAEGDGTNKVIYVKATDSVELFRIENTQ